MAVYTAVSYGLAAALDAAMVAAGSPAWALFLWGLARMYAPAAAACLCALWLEGRRGAELLERLGLSKLDKRGAASYLLSPLAVLAALALALLLEAAVGALSLEPFRKAVATALRVEESSVGDQQLVQLLALQVAAGYFAAVSLNAVFAFGEEVGWRGYLYELLAPRLGLARSSAVIGLLWGFWHAPAILLLGHNYPTRRVEGSLFFPLYLVPVSYVMLVLRELSGSVLPAASFHGAINAWWGLTVLLAPSLGELGAGLGLTGLAAWSTTALITWIARKIGARAAKALNQ